MLEWSKLGFYPKLCVDLVDLSNREQKRQKAKTDVFTGTLFTWAYYDILQKLREDFKKFYDILQNKPKLFFMKCEVFPKMTNDFYQTYCWYISCMLFTFATNSRLNILIKRSINNLVILLSTSVLSSLVSALSRRFLVTFLNKLCCLLTPSMEDGYLLLPPKYFLLCTE